MADRTVYLTEEGEEKVGYDTIPTTDEEILFKGPYIAVTSKSSGKTYILSDDDIEYVD